MLVFDHQQRTWVEKQLRLRQSKRSPRSYLSICALAVIAGGGLWTGWSHLQPDGPASAFAVRVGAILGAGISRAPTPDLNDKSQRVVNTDPTRILLERLEQSPIQQAPAPSSAGFRNAAIRETSSRETPSSPVPSSAGKAPGGALAYSVTSFEPRESFPIPGPSEPSTDIPGIPSTFRQTLSEAPTAVQLKSDMPTDEQQELMARVAAMIRQGDIAGARVILARLDRTGNSRATFALAQTYDPVMLNQWKVRGIKAEPGKAVELYQRAADQGLGAAQERLAALALQQR